MAVLQKTLIKTYIVFLVQIVIDGPASLWEVYSKITVVHCTDKCKVCTDTCTVKIEIQGE